METLNREQCLRETAYEYIKSLPGDCSKYDAERAFISGANWQLENFQKYSDYIEFLSNYLPENMPLYKDSGLWQLRSDDMNEVKLQQFVNEKFIDFLIRCKQFNIEEILKP